MSLFTQNLYALSILPFKSSLFVKFVSDRIPDSWQCNFGEHYKLTSHLVVSVATSPRLHTKTCNAIWWRKSSVTWPKLFHQVTSHYVRNALRSLPMGVDLWKERVCFWHRTIPVEVDLSAQKFVFSTELLMIVLAKAWDSDAHRVMYRTIPIEVDLSTTTKVCF